MELRGRLAGKEGIFPTNLVKIEDLPREGGAVGGVDTPTLHGAKCGCRCDKL